MIEEESKPEISSDEEDEPEVKKTPLTDEEIFKACKGLTAHKYTFLTSLNRLN